MTAQRILDRKGTTVITVKQADKVSAVAGILSENNIGAVVFSDSGTNVQGVFSERDLVHGIADEGPGFIDKSVGEAMTTAVETCSTDSTIHEMLAKMTNRRIRHLPVVEGGKLAGMVSIGEVVKLRLDELVNEAEAMRAYISG